MTSVVVYLMGHPLQKLCSMTPLYLVQYHFDLIDKQSDTTDKNTIKTIFSIMLSPLLNAHLLQFDMDLFMLC